MGDARRIRHAFTGRRLQRQVQAVACGVSISGIEQRKIIRVATVEVAHQIVLEVHLVADEAFGQAYEVHSGLSQPAEVDRVAAPCTTDRNGHVLLAGLHGFAVPQPQHTHPPAEIPAAIGARRTVVRADRQVHFATREQQLLGDLHTRGTSADHQYAALRQLLRIEIVRRVDLMKRLVNRRNRRDDRLLERPCRRDQMIDHIGAGTGFDGKACTPGVAGNALDLDAGLDRRVECAGIALEVLGHLLLAREPVLIHGEFKAGKPVMPGRTVGHQRVPAATAPCLGNAVFFKHQVLDAKTAQVFAGGHSGLPCTYDERIDFYDFFCHLGIPRQVIYGVLT
ncbi:Uncharacterized protein ALO75_05350 [Pseudomonas syringae pv. coryli]|uniref:Uncharacterized protein n=1 Tax=Pseudomonas syringae pv. coryli TaxID=317659 RepID=A0A0P9N9M3_9PSED|nr:Uncharacterized protein ALO75_05350 [Pseudomonas syringae pv. coryli]